MMTNVRCVTVFCIDMQGLSQHSVHENNSKIVAILTSKCYETVVSCEKNARFFILQHHHQIKVCWTTSDPASSEDRLYSGASAIATVE